MEQRRQVLTMCQCEALLSACRNARLNVVQYLWENMGDELKTDLVDSRFYCILSKCIFESASSFATDPQPLSEIPMDGEPILRYFFSDGGEESSSQAPTKVQLFNALLSNNAAALKALLNRAEQGNKWGEVSKYLQIFDTPERDKLYEKMTVGQRDGLSGKVSTTDAAAGIQPATEASMSTACIPKSSVVNK